MRSSCAVAAIAAAVLMSTASADVILDQSAAISNRGKNSNINSSSSALRAADDFTLGSQSTVGTFAFWGRMYNPSSATSNLSSFTVTFFDLNGTGVLPGTTIRTQEFAVDAVSIESHNAATWRYEVSFGDGFDLAAGNYAVMVAANLTDAGGDYFQWYYGTGGNGRGLIAEDGVNWADEESTLVVVPLTDFAWTLGTPSGSSTPAVPGPAGVAMLGLMLPGLRGRRRG